MFLVTPSQYINRSTVLQYCIALLQFAFLQFLRHTLPAYSTVSTQSVLHNFRNLPRAGEIIIIIHPQGISSVE